MAETIIKIEHVSKKYRLGAHWRRDSAGRYSKLVGKGAPQGGSQFKNWPCRQ